MDFSQPSTKCQTHRDFMGFTDLPQKTTHLRGFHWGFYEYSILLRALALSWGKQRNDPTHLGMATAHLCLPPQKYINIHIYIYKPT